MVAIAGRLEGDTLINSNLQWPVSVRSTRDAARVTHLALLNDFEAVACAMSYVDAATMTRVCGPERAGNGPALVLGPGTGFGAALCLPSAQQRAPLRVLASEAGHAALAAGTARELDLVRHLLKRWPHVDNERVLSGPGLVNTYQALCELDGVTPALDNPEAIAAAAQADTDARAVETLQIVLRAAGQPRWRSRGHLRCRCGVPGRRHPGADPSVPARQRRSPRASATRACSARCWRACRCGWSTTASWAWSARLPGTTNDIPVSDRSL